MKAIAFLTPKLCEELTGWLAGGGSSREWIDEKEDQAIELLQEYDQVREELGIIKAALANAALSKMGKKVQK